ncbi:hypothetical protein BC832DRAFT_386552 [Gaertneriomyces semiglobifer]|nr:hypothetical protein BC832DRAFT_386552 [Gaertneriomyces semiglobifer]
MRRCVALAGRRSRQRSGSLLGGPCDPLVDVFGCNGRDYMACDPTSNRWILQNQCPSDCLGIPSFAANCGRNSQGIGGGSPTVSSPPPPPISPTSPPTASSRPPQSAGTPSSGSDPSNPPRTNTPSNTSDNSNSSSGISGGAIAGIVVGVLLLVFGILLALWCLLWRKKKGAAKNLENGGPTVHTEMLSSKTLFSDGAAAHLNVASVLEKRYVVAHDYQPAADDEIRLTSGDVVRLHLLFNDGWAKGINESTGQQGLLPCACIQEILPQR